MKKSVIIAFIIFLAVTAWFLSGKISIGSDNLQDNTYNKNSNKLIITIDHKIVSGTFDKVVHV